MTVCWGCARILAKDRDPAARRGYVRSAPPCKPGGLNDIVSACQSCFAEFSLELSFQVFQVDSTWTLADVSSRVALVARSDLLFLVLGLSLEPPRDPRLRQLAREC